MAILLYDLCSADPQHRFSPYCWRVHMALAHKGVVPDIKPVPFTSVAAVENGFSKTLPVLNHDGTLVRESFEIATFLEKTYPQAPSLFDGEGGVKLSRLFESYVDKSVMPKLAKLVVLDVHDSLAPADQSYFRQSREARFGTTLEDFTSNKEATRSDLSAALLPVRALVSKQSFLGGEQPLYADYILFGSLQWARVASAEAALDTSDSLVPWFDRCLDLHGGLGRQMPAKAA